ncbi:MAG: DUF2273 domain-containing protein [Actinobacteria bacterium]|nr:DUF2273 domain-containing protein [Actinomycetota bacterium]
MQRRKAWVGATAGAVLAIIWAALGFGAVLLVLALAALGGAIGVVIDRPDSVIDFLQRMQER